MIKKDLWNAVQASEKAKHEYKWQVRKANYEATIATLVAIIGLLLHLFVW